MPHALLQSRPGRIYVRVFRFVAREDEGVLQRAEWKRRPGHSPFMQHMHRAMQQE